MSDIIEYVVRVSPDGVKRWYRHNGQYHREDGPAIEYPNGSKEWYLNGKYHREDGPAIESSDGTKCWYLHGKRHREDGPAIEYGDGRKWWFLNGKQFSESEWKKEMNKKQTFDGKLIEIDGKRYKLVEI
jgi:hypothetical protein